MDQQNIIFAPALIEKANKELVPHPGEKRIEEKSFLGENCLVFDERKRPKVNLEVNWLSVQKRRALKGCRNVNLIKTDFGYVVFPVTPLEETSYKMIKNTNSAECLRKAFDESFVRFKKLVELIEYSEKAIVSQCWSSIDWNALFNARANYKAADIDKIYPKKIFDEVIDCINFDKFILEKTGSSGSSVLSY